MKKHLLLTLMMSIYALPLCAIDQSQAAINTFLKATLDNAYSRPNIHTQQDIKYAIANLLLCADHQSPINITAFLEAAIATGNCTPNTQNQKDIEYSIANLDLSKEIETYNEAVAEFNQDLAEAREKYKDTFPSWQQNCDRYTPLINLDAFDKQYTCDQEAVGTKIAIIDLFYIIRETERLIKHDLITLISQAEQMQKECACDAIGKITDIQLKTRQILLYIYQNNIRLKHFMQTIVALQHARRCMLTNEQIDEIKQDVFAALSLIRAVEPLFI
jgi:hypothetical protein